MSVYNEASWTWRGLKWAHLLADDLDKLHRFAHRLGIHRLSFQAPPKSSSPHYDITAFERRRALAYVAVLRRNRQRTARPSPEIFSRDGETWSARSAGRRCSEPNPECAREPVLSQPHDGHSAASAHALDPPKIKAAGAKSSPKTTGNMRTPLGPVETSAAERPTVAPGASLRTKVDAELAQEPLAGFGD